MNSVIELARQSGLGTYPVSVRALLQKYHTNSLRQAFAGRAGGVRFCGVPDDPQWQLHPNVNPLTYGHAVKLWTKGALTFNVNASGARDAVGAQVNPAAVTADITNALMQWRAASVRFFTFTNVNGNADLMFSFGSSDVDSRLGMAGGVAGLGAPPPTGGVYFDSAEAWAVGKPAIGVEKSLLAVALHEIGHALGLKHSTNPGSLMYPFGPDVSTIDLESIQAVRNMYGWRPQTRINELSSDSPALAVGETFTLTSRTPHLYMAWKGTGGDQVLHVAEFDGATFSIGRERLDDFRSSHGPALASYRRGGNVTGLIMAWKGEGADQGIYFSQNPDLQGWSPFKPVPGAFSNARPALGQLGNDMVIAWKGMGDDQGIYWSKFDGNSWAPFKNILGRATSHAPALASADSRLYMFWKGMGDDQRIFYSWMDAQPDLIWQPGRQIVYTVADTGGMSLKAVFTDHHLGAVVRNDTVFVAWKGMKGDKGVLFSTQQPGDVDWSGEIRVSNVTSSTGPAMAQMDGRVFMAWKGEPGDEGLSFSSLG